jgi:ribonuclease P protein component
MLPILSRLSHTKSFAIVFKEGYSATSQELSLKWRKTNLPQSQVGFVVSKKNFAKAVDRNYAKRLLREAMKAELFALRAGFDIIVLYRYKPEHVRLDTLVKNLHLLLEKNNLLEKIT